MNGTFSSRMDLYWQSSSGLYLVIADIFWSILLATCLSCLIEAPILGLERIFLRPPKKEKKEQPLQSKEGNLSQPLMGSQDISIQEIPEKLTVGQKEEGLLL